MQSLVRGTAGSADTGDVVPRSRDSWRSERAGEAARTLEVRAELERKATERKLVVDPVLDAVLEVLLELCRPFLRESPGGDGGVDPLLGRVDERLHEAVDRLPLLARNLRQRLPVPELVLELRLGQIEICSRLVEIEGGAEEPEPSRAQPIEAGEEIVAQARKQRARSTRATP